MTIQTEERTNNQKGEVIKPGLSVDGEPEVAPITYTGYPPIPSYRVGEFGARGRQFDVKQENFEFTFKNGQYGENGGRVLIMEIYDTEREEIIAEVHFPHLYEGRREAEEWKKAQVEKQQAAINS